VSTVPQRQIRASFDRDSIVVYQAYDDRIADAVLKAGRFVAPFSFTRMTWIKPSFLWLMARSNGGAKSRQERTLAVRITRTGWEEALGMGVLTAYHPGIHADFGSWEGAFDDARVHVQWDPERSVRGEHLQHDSIQVGLSRHVIRRFAEEWVVGIEDLTATVDKIRAARDRGRQRDAKRHLPREAVYPVPATIGRALGVGR
jgi:hypothetical protein